MNIDTKDFMNRLKTALEELSEDTPLIRRIQTHLVKHKIPSGDIMKLFLFPDEIDNVDGRLLYLLTKYIFIETEDEKLRHTVLFTESEIKEGELYTGELERVEEKALLPMKIDNVSKVGENSYLLSLSIQEINELLTKQVLYYDFDMQREAVKVKRRGVIVRIPKIFKNSIKQISDHISEGTLFPTSLVWNATIGTSNDGDELEFDHRKHTLLINAGTKIAILDGYHRLRGLQNALIKNPRANFSFPIILSNLTILEAEKFAAQIAKANPISTVKQQEMEKAKYSDEVVSYLKKYSELKGRISEEKKVNHDLGEIVSFDILSDAIDKLFKLERKIEVKDVQEYLSEFFDLLLGIYNDEFIDNISSFTQKSLINNKYMFIGYLTIAKRLYFDNKPVSIQLIKNFMKNIDFSKENSVWQKHGLTETNNGKIRIKQKVNENKLIEYFNTLPL